MSQRPWEKFAILGSTYARALQNAAQRSGAQLPQNVLNAIASRPTTQIASGLAQRARGGVAGAVAPTPHQQRLQAMTARLPETGEGLPGSPGEGHATQRFMFNTMFGNRVQMSQNPSIQPLPRAPAQAPARAQPPRGVPLRTTDPLPPHVLPPGQLGQPAQVGRFEAFAQNPHARAGAADGTVVRRKVAAALPTAVGVGIPLAVGGGLLASKPGIQSNLKNLMSGKGSTQEQDTSGALPEPVLHHADLIHQKLLEHGLDPASLRMGIDAPPGSGKTTLARALSQRAGMKHYGLDWEPGNWWKSTVGLGRNVEKMPRAPKAGEILEHYMLGRTYDPELFDVMVHIHRDPNVIREQLRNRGNAAYISDLMDLDKSLGVADLGFNTLAGETIDLGDGVQMKLRPREGWGNAVDQQLMQLGIDPTGLSRHEKLLSLHAGKRTTGAGWTPYVKNPLSTGETLALGASVPLGVMAARALARRSPVG